jgi:hypothetical protein
MNLPLIFWEMVARGREKSSHLELLDECELRIGSAKYVRIEFPVVANLCNVVVFVLLIFVIGIHVDKWVLNVGIFVDVKPKFVHIVTTKNFA